MEPETIRDIRIEILRYLYARPSAAMSEAAILRAVRKAGVECDLITLAMQCGVLARQNSIEQLSDPDMPAIKAWKITGAGIHHFETHHA